MTIAQISSSTPLHRPKWHLIYFALAALNLLTIGAALYLSYGLRAIYAESVRVNQVLNDRLARYNELETIAGAVDAPGNDVFVSHDAAGESARLQAALAQFDWKLEGERREIERSLPPRAALRKRQRFDAVEAALREMTAQAGKIFTDFGNNNPGRAAEHMAAMDQAFASLHVALEAMQDDVREAQKRHLLEQAALAESLKKYEWSLAAMILLLVAGVALYGRRLTRGVNEAYELQRRAHDTELIHVQENHRMLASVVEQTDDAVTITDPDGVIEYVNPAFERMTGYSRSEVLGRKPSLLKSDRHDQAFYQRLWRTVLGGAPFREVFTNRRKNGEIYYEQKTITPLKDKHGKIVRLVSTGKDITEHRLAQEQMQRLAYLLEESLNEIYVFDAETLKFQLVNRGARENLGYSMEELRALTPVDLKPEYTPESFTALIRPLRTGEQHLIRFLTVHRRKDGSTYPVEVHLQLFSDVAPAMFIAIILDITERKRAEEQVQHQLKELIRWQNVMLGREDRVRKLKREINELLERLGEPIRYPSQATPEQEPEEAAQGTDT